MPDLKPSRRTSRQHHDLCDRSDNMKSTTKNPIVKRFVSCLHNYFSNTTVHGVKYLTEYQRPLIERIVWLIGIIIAFTACTLLIQESWRSRWESPVVLTLEKKQHTIWDIPFPAVSICPLQKLKSEVSVGSPAINESKNDHDCAIHLICGKSVGEICKNSSDPLQFIFQKSKQRHDVIFHMQMGNKYTIGKGANTNTLLTIDGICHVFNMFPESHIFTPNTFHAARGKMNGGENVTWDPQSGYNTNSFEEKFPQAPMGIGPDYSLLFILFEEKEKESCGLEKGFKVQLHNPAEFPSSESEFLVPLNSRVRISLEPDLIFTKKGELENYAVEHRQCFFPEERSLEFFEVYTQNNCEFECFSKAALNCCECVPHYLPRNKSAEICRTQEDHECIGKIKAKMATSDIRPENLPCPKASFCNCLPSCSHLRYRGRSSHIELDEHLVHMFFNDPRLTNASVSVVEISFPSEYFIPIRRLELKGTIDFIADCGGVLGLCLGMSLLSVMELLYWLLVRPGWCRRCRSKALPPAGAAEQLALPVELVSVAELRPLHGTTSED